MSDTTYLSIGITEGVELVEATAERGTIALLCLVIVVLVTALIYVYTRSQTREDKIHRDYQALFKEMHDQVRTASQQLIETSTVLNQFGISITKHQEQMKNMLDVHMAQLTTKITELFYNTREK
jgi:uncharacterized protein HemX